VDIGRIAFSGQPQGEKVSETPISTNKVDTVVYIYNRLFRWHRQEDYGSRPALGKKCETLSEK
jgi:hypothetical protein